MNIELRFGANKGVQQPSEMLYLANQENALLAHTLNRQILEETAHKTSEDFEISTRFWSKSRSYRKQSTKPFLPEATTTPKQAPPRAICESLSAMLGTLERPQIRRTAAPLLSTKDQPYLAQPRKACVVHLESGATVRSHEA